MSYEQPSQQQVEGLIMEWHQLHPHGATPTEKALDNLTATFMLSPFGRPGVLFDAVKWLNRDTYSNVLATRENHQYLALIATHLFGKNYTNIHALSQIIKLIRDFDGIFTPPNDLPYKGDFQGFLKIAHADFKDLREKLESYVQLLSKDRAFLAKVRETGNYDESIKTLKSVLEFSPN